MAYEEQLHMLLSTCDKDQLNKYLTDDDSLDLLVKSIEQYQNIAAEKERLERENKEKAERNLKMEPMLNSLKAGIKQAIERFEKVKLEYLSLKESHDVQVANQASPMSLSGVSAQLDARATKAEEDTDRMAEDFFVTKAASNVVHTEDELNNFQRQFLEERTQAQLKKIKAEKMKELIQRK
jgi:hypothetical protein